MSELITRQEVGRLLQNIEAIRQTLSPELNRTSSSANLNMAISSSKNDLENDCHNLLVLRDAVQKWINTIPFADDTLKHFAPLQYAVLEAFRRCENLKK